GMRVVCRSNRVAVRVMPKGLGVALVVVCATSAPAAQHAPRPLRVIGLVRDPAGAPVAGAVVWVNLPRQITFTGKDGRFELARPVSDSARRAASFVAGRRAPDAGSPARRFPQRWAA